MARAVLAGAVICGALVTVRSLTADAPHDGRVVVAGYDLGHVVDSPLNLSLLPELPLSLNRDQDDGASGGFYLRSPVDGTASLELGPVVTPAGSPRSLVIARGQSFYDALAARGAAHADIMALVNACKPFRNLRSVKHGELFRVQVGADGTLLSLGFDLDEESHVTWVRNGDSYVREDGTYPVERRFQGVSGSIDGSLSASLEDLGAPAALSAKLNDILGWEIDFRRDLRRGDMFKIIYEEVWRSGKLVRSGAIQAVEIVCQGRPRRAYLFDDGSGRDGYYDQKGGSLQKQLMRAPLQYSRISSGFSYRRFHPVLNKWAPHLGVDYAAPLGTPVKAGGDGVVAAATAKGGNGRYVHIKHSKTEYETYYLHLSRIAKGVVPGARVTQGQVIGYVGATGYATGPHLDYRIKKGGKFIDPRTMKAGSAAPLAGALQARFQEHASQLSMALAALSARQATPVQAPLYAAAPPAWDSSAYAMTELPEVVRTMQ